MNEKCNVYCEWGEQGIKHLTAISDVIIIVDVVSFSTTTEIVCSRDAYVLPYQCTDSAKQFAFDNNALLAGPRNGQGGYSLSPHSVINIPAKTRLVLPSPNGATLSLSTGSTPTLIGSLRNAAAVAAVATKLGKNIALIPAGERWPDKTLRPSIEDWLGVGAIAKHLKGVLSPEAQLATIGFEGSKHILELLIKTSHSGKELASVGFATDIDYACQLNVSECVPILKSGIFEKY